MTAVCCGQVGQPWLLHPDRLHKRPDTQDRDHPLHVVGQNLQAHLGAGPLHCPRQEVSSAHPGLDRGEQVLGGLPSQPHRTRHLVEPFLHGVKHVLMLPPLDPAFLACHTLGLSEIVFTQSRWEVGFPEMLYIPATMRD